MGVKKLVTTVEKPFQVIIMLHVYDSAPNDKFGSGLLPPCNVVPKIELISTYVFFSQFNIVLEGIGRSLVLVILINTFDLHCRINLHNFTQVVSVILKVSSSLI